MNVERLNKIDENKELNVCGITGKILSIELPVRDYSYLYTRAEQFQKLEKDVIEWETVNRCWEMININLVEQIKRYREALNNIYELVEYDEYNNTLEQIVSEIEKALEV